MRPLTGRRPRSSTWHVYWGWAFNQQVSTERQQWGIKINELAQGVRKPMPFFGGNEVARWLQLQPAGLVITNLLRGVVSLLLLLIYIYIYVLLDRPSLKWVPKVDSEVRSGGWYDIGYITHRLSTGASTNVDALGWGDSGHSCTSAELPQTSMPQWCHFRAISFLVSMFAVCI